jgi:hypothetical protein
VQAPRKEREAGPGKGGSLSTATHEIGIWRLGLSVTLL